MLDRPFGELVEDRTGHERVQPATHPHQRRGLTGFFIDFDRDRMILPRLGEIADIGGEDQRLVLALADNIDPCGNEGRDLHLDADLLDRGHKVVNAIVIFPQDRGKQSYKTVTCNARSFVPPRTVTFDDHVHLAAIVGMPLVYRRQPVASLAGGVEKRLHRIARRRCGGHGQLSCATPCS
jgi:hypothetical protein